MPDKLTDKEIVKALEICSKYTDVRNCENCPLKPNCDVNVLETLSLDLINRLQAENEKNENIIRLADKTIATQNANIDRLNYENLQMIASIKHLKSEAYKEFAERLKENFEPLNSPLLNNRIDNLLKELVGEDND